MIDEVGKKWLLESEGYRTEAYLDTVGVWTIGVGHTGFVDGIPIHRGMTISDAKVMELFEEDIKKHSTFLNYFTRSFNQNQINALTSFEFNLGSGIWAKDKWVRNATDEYIIDSMRNYRTPPEIWGRRQKEIRMYQTPSSVPTPDIHLPIGGEIQMKCTYQIDGKATVYYFDGESVKALTHPDQWQVLKNIYKACNGKELPHFLWTSGAPWYERLKQVVQLKKQF